MARDDFLPAVEADLQLRHVPFDRRARREYLEAMAPLLTEDDSPAWWGDAFLETQGTELGLSDLGGRPAALVEPGMN
jgi:hypothetical protein